MSSKSADMLIPRYSMLGLPVNALTKDDLVSLVAEAVADNKRFVIGHHNLHGLYEAQREPKMRQFYASADFVHADGMSLVAIGRLLGVPLQRKDRTGYVDLLPTLVERASAEGWRIFYLGSKPGVAEKGAAILRAQHPALQIEVHDGYFNSSSDAAENAAVLEKIARYQPHVLLVGMGMPRQEVWVLENHAAIQSNTVFCCGALIDYVAGELATPPRWLGQIGLEWLYRLIVEPSRLWRRYLLEPWTVFRVVAKEWMSSTRRKAEPVSGNGPVS